ncbi:CGNR zinc finger domain-containing protein [Actinacidiphila acidipaludis]|uniref:CGNR zinc finger domain-containing protein n=1 Tax=Actinacidiphila acidipaludis TaxID=2873382 RepID=A0ABS7QIZ5_9ACTN|nr:CGNR zinc finger domain-containing protein [Streptomyces acidipaludis]
MTSFPSPPTCEDHAGAGAKRAPAGGFGALPAAAADLAARGGRARLKRCKDPSCHTGMFDKTRNSSDLQCSSACGTRMAARACRSRDKSSSWTRRATARWRSAYLRRCSGLGEQRVVRGGAAPA